MNDRPGTIIEEHGQAPPRESGRSEGVLSVAVMGQTGVGKSSLLNALFGTSLPTHPSQPSTREETPLVFPAPLRGGGEIRFIDLPGIGETVEADERYLATYLRHLIDADVVIWAIHADNRSVAFDQAALKRLLQRASSDAATVMAKITFVLTKVDLLSVPPWIYTLDGDQGFFTPDPKISKIIEEKVDYVHRSFLQDYEEYIKAWTYNDARFESRGPFEANENFVWHRRGLVTQELYEEYVRRYPRYTDLLTRLRDSHRASPCSALFRYNLTALLIAIEGKLGPAAVDRFRSLTIARGLDTVLLDDARLMNNLVIVDKSSQSVVFDLARWTPARPA